MTTDNTACTIVLSYKMPVIVQDYKWRQTERMVTIRIPLHGVSKMKVDILTSEQYIKGSFEQFFFELFLLHTISLQSSKCTIHEKEIIYELAKLEQIPWDRLEKQLTKDEKKEVRRDALQAIENKLTSEHELKLTKKDQLKRCAIGEAISLDTQQRSIIDKIKTEEKLNALGEINSWNAEAKTAKIRRATVSKQQKKETVIPSTRGFATLLVDFTPRELPTPSRESNLAEETEWLTKQAEAIRSAGFVSEDLRPEEKNPQYLLAKGNEFLKNSNYLAAISAYTFGIKMSSNYSDLYIKRSEAQFKIGNLHKCVKDCSTAIALMTPEVNANLKERSICIGRRGMALHKLGLKKQAIDELKASLKLCECVEYATFLQSILHEPVLESEEQTDCGSDLLQ